MVSYDFDKDGIADSCGIVKTADSIRLAYMLSSTNFTVMGSQWVQEYAIDNNYLSVKNNVLIFTNKYNRSTILFKFRYNNKIKKFTLIGYENEQFGGANGDGSGKSSYNLLTGQYVANCNYVSLKKEDLQSYPPIIKALPIKIYLLNNFSTKVIEALYAIDDKFKLGQ